MLRFARIRIKLCERAAGKVQDAHAKVQGTAARDYAEVPVLQITARYTLKGKPV